MTDAEVILMQREAIARYCKGNRKLAIRIIVELGFEMRQWIESRRGGEKEQLSADDLLEIIKSSAGCWPEA